MRILQNKSTRTLISIMLVLVVIAIVIAGTYYRKQNNSVDPRVLRARELYARYDSYASSGEFKMIFRLLDSIEAEYLAYKHYSSSYEPGVLNNNRAAALLTIALYSDSIAADRNPFAGMAADSLVSMAEIKLTGAIEVYRDWLSIFADKPPDEIRDLIRDDFMEGLPAADQNLKERYLDARVKEIEKSVPENRRRLSVSYTNLGVVYRHRGSYQEAIAYYEKALELWDRNLEAENNINRLLGRPLKKRNIIQKLFPPDRE